VNERPSPETVAASKQAGVRGAAVAFIFVTILLDMLALGLIMPILPKLVESFVDNDTARAARIFGLFGTGWALMQFFFSPVLGALSDRFGRRPVVLLSNFGLALDYVLMALAPSLSWLFVGRLISGVTSASISTAFAYIADITPPERRAAVFGKVGAAFGAGFILGPAIGGLLGGMDPRLPFWVAAGLSFVNTLYGMLILPESLPRDRRSAFRWKQANPFGALHLLRSDRVLAALSVVNFITQLAHVVLPSTFVLYATYRYGWDTTTVGLTLAMVGICAMAVQGAAIGPIVQLFGERRSLLLGLVCGVAGFLIFGMASSGKLFWLGIPAMALWGVAGAAMQALMTQRVPPDRQGQLQGALSSVQSLSQLVGPFLFTMTFAYFIGGSAPLKLPGAPFLLASALVALALIVAARTLTIARIR
jgi:DHA1 family tetracycline resistance protein-like MFS transporter